jgi:hypothetical protein
MDVAQVVSLIGIIISISSFGLALYNANETVKIKRQITRTVIQSLISFYRTVNDYNTFIWMAFREKRKLRAASVAAFYKDRISDLTELHSLPEYHLYLKSLQISVHGRQDTKRLTEEYLLSLTDNYHSQHIKEKISKIAGQTVYEAISSLELNMYFAMLDLVNKLSEIADFEGDISSTLLDDVPSDEKDQPHPEAIAIMKVMLHTINSIELLFNLLLKNETQLLKRVNSFRLKK